MTGSTGIAQFVCGIIGIPTGVAANGFLNTYYTFINSLHTPETAAGKIGSGNTIFNGNFNGLCIDDGLLFRVFYWGLATAEAVKEEW